MPLKIRALVDLVPANEKNDILAIEPYIQCAIPARSMNV